MRPSFKAFRLIAWVLGSVLLGCSPDPRTVTTPPASLQQALESSELAVTASITEVRPYRGTNRFGDRLIFSRTTLQVEESLKGNAGPQVVFDCEGGEIDGIRLEVSDLPALHVGERGVFFLRREGTTLVPARRGDAILKLDERDRVRGTGVRLEDIRALVRDRGVTR